MKKMMILDRNLDKYVDLLVLLLIKTDKYSMLPELLEVFGGDKLGQFLSIFEGCTIRVPSIQELKGSLRDIDIYVSLNKSILPEEKSRLASKYDVSVDMIEKIFAYMTDLVSGEFKMSLTMSSR